MYTVYSHEAEFFLYLKIAFQEKCKGIILLVSYIIHFLYTYICSNTIKASIY